MAKTQNTKRALLSSVLALVVCVAMLVGSTFAWFTDSASTSGNTIVSGNLDVALEMYDEANNKWINAEGKTLKWVTTDNVDNVLWEPGCTYKLPKLRIVNNGNLALKYQVVISGLEGDAELLDVIEFTGIPAEDQYVELKEKGDSEEFQIIGHMLETAGNKYMGLELSGITITVYATQLAHEYDSIDNQYDAKATYLNKDASGAWLINNLDELYFFASQVNGGNTYAGETVKLTDDIDLSGYKWTPIGTTEGTLYFAGTFDGQGYTISNITAQNSLASGFFGVTDGATIKNLKVANATVSGNHCAGAVVGKAKFTTIEACSASDASVTLVPRVVNGAYDDGNHAGGVAGYAYACDVIDCTAKDVAISAYRDAGGIVGTIEGYTNSVYPDKWLALIDGCSADGVDITIDQVTCFYAVKNANAGGIVGRKAGNTDAITISNNTESNVNIKEIIPVANTSALQSAIDKAKSGDTIYLSKGVSYGTLTVKPTADNNTVMLCETHSFTTTNEEEFKTHLSDGKYHTTPRYTTTLENITIIGAEGATVEGLLITSGHIYGDTYDYVLDKDYTVGSAYYSTLNITGLEFKNINFTGKVNINTSDADTVYNGIKFEECTFTTGGTASSNGPAIRYYNEANNGKLQNIVVNKCTFTNCYQGVYVHHVNGITVTDCTFDTLGHNAIAMQSHDGAVNLKNVTIIGNTFNNVKNRAIRFNEVGADSNITIKNNTATNSGDEDKEIMKATSIAAGVTTSISGNNWGTGVVANNELKDN